MSMSWQSCCCNPPIGASERQPMLTYADSTQLLYALQKWGEKIALCKFVLPILGLFPSQQRHQQYDVLNTKTLSVSDQKCTCTLIVSSALSAKCTLPSSAKNSPHTFAGEENWASCIGVCYPCMWATQRNRCCNCISLTDTGIQVQRLAYYKHVNATFCLSSWWYFLFKFLLYLWCDALTISKSMLSWLRFQ